MVKFAHLGNMIVLQRYFHVEWTYILVVIIFVLVIALLKNLIFISVLLTVVFIVM